MHWCRETPIYASMIRSSSVQARACGNKPLPKPMLPQLARCKQTSVKFEWKRQTSASRNCIENVNKISSILSRLHSFLNLLYLDFTLPCGQSAAHCHTLQCLYSAVCRIALQSILVRYPGSNRWICPNIQWNNCQHNPNLYPFPVVLLTSSARELGVCPRLALDIDTNFWGSFEYFQYLAKIPR